MGTEREGGCIPDGKKFVGGVKGTKKVPQCLKDMRLVYKGEEPEGGWSRGQLKLVKLFEENYEKFHDRLQRAEKDHAAGRVKVTGASNPESAVVEKSAVSDAGAGRARALIEQILREAGV
jgi:hypothetical protein